MSRRRTLTTTCHDTAGISGALGMFVVNEGGFILDSQQFGDSETGRFFSRIAFTAAAGKLAPLQLLREHFAAVTDRFGMDWAIVDAEVRPRVLIGVSKFGHCLNDLLYRWKSGSLPVDIVGVFSNHDDMRAMTEWHGIAYHHLPVSNSTRGEQEGQLLALIEQTGTDCVVLARYMQVFSDALCSKLAWRCINIHHSFLPSFQGAKPYHQAHGRGVKIIGATAHYVTEHLDEGPIIEQNVERVDHALSAEQLVEVGRDVEALVLSRAVRWHAERRVLRNGQKTVVFR